MLMADSRATTAKEKEAKSRRFMSQDSTSLLVNVMYDPHLQLSLNQFLSMMQTLKTKTVVNIADERCVERAF